MYSGIWYANSGKEAVIPVHAKTHFWKKLLMRFIMDV